LTTSRRNTFRRVAAGILFLEAVSESDFEFDDKKEVIRATTNHSRRLHLIRTSNSSLKLIAIRKEEKMGTLLLIILVLLLVGVIPAWPYSRSWGYYPSGIIGLVLVVLLVLFLLGRL
jgi:hypothetical protein